MRHFLDCSPDNQVLVAIQKLIRGFSKKLSLAFRNGVRLGREAGDDPAEISSAGIAIALILGIVAATAVHSNIKAPHSCEPLNETVVETVDWPAACTPITMMQGYDRYLSEPNFTLTPTQYA